MDSKSEFLHLAQYTLLGHATTKGLEVMKTYTIFMLKKRSDDEGQMIAKSIPSIFGIILDALQNISWCEG